MLKRTLLIDADMTVHRICTAHEHEWHWTRIDENDEEYPDQWAVKQSNLIDCEATLVATVAVLRQELEADRVILAFSDKTTNVFRKQFYPSYKGNRSGDAVKPLNFHLLKAFARREYTVKEIPTLEADDVLGILHTGDFKLGETIIVSYDKDFLQLPGKFYQLQAKGVEEGAPRGVMHNITQAEADVFFLRQVLTGDPVDNYPGHKGFGAVGAEKVLNPSLTLEENWSIIVGLFEKAGLTEEDALIQARCARLLRADEYDFKTNKITLWRS
jgi:DNA polymerase-1